MGRPDLRFRELPPTAGLPLRWADLFGPAPPGGAQAFARDTAAFLDVEALLPVCSGTAALVVALTTLRQASRRRRVVVPAFTCPLVALAVAQCGLELVPCDLVPGGLDMAPDALARLLDSDTLAVLPTHLAGRVADVPQVLALARAAGAWVIEDAAQAFGARTSRGAVGAEGDIGLFSLAVGKGLTLYEGGLLHARDAALRQALHQTAAALLRRDPWLEALRCAQLAGTAALYRPGLLPLAYGLPLRAALRSGDAVGAVGDRFTGPVPLHALGGWRQRVGARALPRLPGFLAEAARRAERWRALLAGVEGLHIFDDRPGEQGTWPVLLLRMPDRASQARAMAALWTSGLGVSRLFIHALPDYAELRGMVPPVPCPAAADLAARTLTIGNSPWTTEADMRRIAAALRQAVRAEEMWDGPWPRAAKALRAA
ncbi:dTDP-4-amino-4,6-dideoxygalactose transaminase [Humitalea rosea]|uniref:dTDP-4-amino-4,6-dideoxygalactose transaminase n=1 Tax=Humitalea rosea TaxID=990373 RepID=A0A2W7IPM0_9PROT|nr:aminotransferase class I/II-fold pyridoxal phosphate-dependent enzyme [Humitalea rosea]PZW49192.1 dTDP-4-amino-4,6-dideoxygalactose transaminase [Humitalea rosea]